MDYKEQKIFTNLKQRKTLERLDVFPFIILHSLCLVLYGSFDISVILKMIIFALLFLAQFVVFFAKFWSESLRSSISFKVAKDLSFSTHIRIDIVNNKFKMNNRTGISEIIHSVKDELISIEFEKIKYLFNKEKSLFEKSKINFKKRLGEFKDSNPYTSEQEVEKLKLKYGNNIMKVPIPSFFSLYKEHIVAPFFVFQLFCILLWVFDDYGLHSGMTLMMLCIFEATVVAQRIINLVTLRKMRVPPQYIFVYRKDEWKKISSSELIPGDIVSILDGSSTEVCHEQQDDEEESSNLILSFLKKLKEMKQRAEAQRRQQPVTQVINRNRERDSSPLTCDMLILSGSAIVNEAMLTGESVPQIKESINKVEHEHNSYFDYKSKHKNNVLFSGTKIVKVSSSEEESDPLPNKVKSYPPDNGCVCLVLKTGFGTSQGKLLRTVLYSSERTKGDSSEAWVFIFILLFFALWAAYYVLKEGIQREGELTYKLFLRTIIIITSVVPAELPIELTLAINNSLFFLQSKAIVCIEPFRIPFAGKINICCFDKTGTLTRDEFIMKGIAIPDTTSLLSPLETDESTITVLLGCNSLMNVGGKIMGDPIELAVFKAAGGTIQNNIIISKQGTRIHLIRRYAFDSVLKRMSVLVTVSSKNTPSANYNRVVSKGAPETMKGLFKIVPKNYDECFNSYAKQGYRVLALGYNNSNLFNIITKRGELEKDLVFCGFVVVETPLKNDTAKYITELKEAEYDICIITGDHQYTTAKVCQDLKLGPKDIAFIKIVNKNSSNPLDETGLYNNNMEKEELHSFYEKLEKTLDICWVDSEDKIVSKVKDVDSIKKLSQKFTLGMTGKELEIIIDTNIIENKHEIFRFIKMYCRVSPMQKDDIVKMLIKAGLNPSMCGDGSNDVGALKRAVIGVALLNSEEKDKNKSKQPFNIFSLEDDSNIKGGDVTAAAPFTAKSGSIKCIKNIFIQGRCTLVITFQMYKILALNCLLTAYSLSVLALKGIKFSDYQSTYMGFVVAFFFLMLSKAEPLKSLNKNKPPYSIFSTQSIVSILGQSITHLICLTSIMNLTEVYDPININKIKSLDDPFAPSLINTVIFIFSAINQSVNFAVNYQGEPFMKNLSENTWLKRLIFFVVGTTLVVIFDLSMELNNALELVPLPPDINYKLCFVGLLSLDFVICYVFENWKKLIGKYV